MLAFVNLLISWQVHLSTQVVSCQVQNKFWLVNTVNFGMYLDCSCFFNISVSSKIYQFAFKLELFKELQVHVHFLYRHNSWFQYHLFLFSIFHFFHFILENNHNYNNKKAWAQTNQILYQHYASKLQKFWHCKFKYEKPDLIKEHNKTREIQNDTYPRPFISSSADPCFLVRPVNAKAFSE